MAISELDVVTRPQTADPPATRWSGLVARVFGPFRRGAERPKQPAAGFYTDTTVCIGCKACEVACKQWNQLPADEFHWSGNSYDNTGALSASSWRHVKFVEQILRDVETMAPAGPQPAADGTIPLTVVRTGAGPGPAPSPAPGAGPAADRWLMMSDVCKHCTVAPCQQACPTGAIIYNEFGNVYIQPDICNGCAYCVAACPFGVITRSTADGHAHKCTLCFDRQRDGLVPACAKACPTASIKFGPIEDLKAQARQRVEDLKRRGVPTARLYGDAETGTYSSLNSFYLLVDRPEVYGLPDKPFNPWLHMAGDYLRTAAVGAVGLGLLALTLLLAGH